MGSLQELVFGEVVLDLKLQTPDIKTSPQSNAITEFRRRSANIIVVKQDVRKRADRQVRAEKDEIQTPLDMYGDLQEANVRAIAVQELRLNFQTNERETDLEGHTTLVLCIGTFTADQASFGSQTDLREGFGAYEKQGNKSQKQ